MPGEFYVEGKAEKTDLSQLITGLSELETKVGSLATPVDFWSTAVNVIDLPVAPIDVALPDVVVSDLPGGAVVARVVAIVKMRVIENTNAGGPNAINGAQAIRVKRSTGIWGVHDIAAIHLPDNLWTVAASTREMGDVLIGNIDLKAVVNAQGTYNLRFENARVDLDYLRLNDVMVGLRFYLSAA